MDNNLTTMLDYFKSQKIELKDENEDGDMNFKGAVSTGVSALDVILGGGYYLGKIYELYGEESAGKTTLSYQSMAEFQKINGIVLLLESESAFDTERARELGVDVAKVLRPKFSSFEEGASIIMRMILSNKKSETPILIVWDTISASPSKAEIDMATSGEMSKVYQDKPILLRSWFRVVSPELSKTKSCLLLVSQVNDIIGFTTSKEKYEPAGGRGIKHHASARIHIKKSTPIFEKDGSKILIGFHTDLQLFKSKQSPEKQKVTVKQFFNSGFHSVSSLLDYLAVSGYSHEDINFGGGGWVTLKIKGIDKKYQGTDKLLEGVMEIQDFPTLDFLKFHAYENLKRLHPITHLITRVDELQSHLEYKPTELKNDKK